jgi:hypothetical protein
MLSFCLEALIVVVVVYSVELFFFSRHSSEHLTYYFSSLTITMRWLQWEKNVDDVKHNFCRLSSSCLLRVKKKSEHSFDSDKLLMRSVVQKMISSFLFIFEEIEIRRLISLWRRCWSSISLITLFSFEMRLFLFWISFVLSWRDHEMIDIFFAKMSSSVETWFDEY